MSYDVIIVGGNFAGLSAAMQLVRALKRVLLIDAARPRNRFSHASHGFLAQDGSSPAAIMAEGKRQLALYPGFEILDDLAVTAKKAGEEFEVETSTGKCYRGRRIILATGVTDILPDIRGVESRWGETVVPCPYCHGYEVRDQPLGVIAGSEHSFQQAMLVADWGPVTYFTQGVHEPDPEQAAQLVARGIVVERSPVVELRGNSPALDSVLLDDGRQIPVKTVFIATTTRMASPLAEQLGCEFDSGPQGPLVRVDPMQETNVKGVYVAGDAANAMANATLASASGVMAGVAAHRSMIF